MLFDSFGWEKDVIISEGISSLTLRLDHLTSLGPRT